MVHAKRNNKSILMGAVAVLGASVGAVSTAYSEPVRLSKDQMDKITAGAPCDGKLCPGVGAPTIIHDDGALQIKFSDQLPAVQGKIESPPVATDRVTITSDSIAIKF